MDEAVDMDARTQRFNEAARTFTLPQPARHAKLLPFKDGIVELRQKGASLRLLGFWLFAFGLIGTLVAVLRLTVGSVFTIGIRSKDLEVF